MNEQYGVPLGEKKVSVGDFLLGKGGERVVVIDNRW